MIARYTNSSSQVKLSSLSEREVYASRVTSRTIVSDQSDLHPINKFPRIVADGLMLIPLMQLTNFGIYNY